MRQLNSKTRSMLLTESSTSDGATLYLVLMPITAEATIEDIFVEIRNELHLYHMILGNVDPEELSKMRLFVNKSAAMRLAQHRVEEAAAADVTNS